MSDKVNETLDAIKNLIPGMDGSTLQGLAKQYVDSDYNRAMSLIELGRKKGLGKHSSDKKAQRRIVRVCILLSLTFKKKAASDVPRYKEELKQKQPALLMVELQSFVHLIPIRANNNQLWLGPSFRSPATQKLIDTCNQGYDLALDVLQKACSDLPKATFPGPSRTLFENYFGHYDITRHQKVSSNIAKILDRLRSKNLWLYYRGVTVNALPQPNDWPFLGAEDVTRDGKLSILQAGGSTHRPDEQTKFWMPRNPYQKQDDMHVKVGAQANGQDKEVICCGVIIHELSHYLCGTRDVKAPLLTHPLIESPQLQNNFSLLANLYSNEHYIYNDSNHGQQIVTKPDLTANRARYHRKNFELAYGDEICKNLANYKPDKAVENADNYNFFCRQYI